MNQGSPSFTSLLSRMKAGDAHARDELIQMVYEDLKRMAARQMRDERPDHTLQPTALVHDLFLGMFQGEEERLENRAHFFALAAREMRHLLVDSARKHRAGKRGGGAVHLNIDEILVYSDQRAPEILALDDALDRLAAIKPEAARVVELVFFGGLTQDEAAVVMERSVRTIKRYWDFARDFLLTEMTPEAP
jgi:RNA polymerase sigma factor (TIGR02999 family)